ncbi:MAG TPA: peptidylprolyl isomerase [Nitrospira sp.]|nr:peptidylprolyl isomerase [Thauera aminoaromatica]HNC84575.1 peptidylprolyl isomerase [Nitrospira sp.]
MKLLRPLVFVVGTTVFSQSAFSADSTFTDGESSISLSELKTELLSLPPDIRAKISADKKALARFAGGVLQDRRIADAAVAAGFTKTDEIKAKIRRAERDVVVQSYLTAEAARTTSEAQDFRSLAREQFEVNRAAYAVPEAVRISHILVRVDPEDDRLQEREMREKAESILSKLKEGADFSELAKQNSDDKGSANRGGELPGWVEKGKTVPPFEKAAFALKPGELSDLVRTRYGFHIIKQLEYRRAANQEFGAVEAQLTNKLRTDFLKQRQSEFVARFAGTQDIQIDDATFEAVTKN